MDTGNGGKKTAGKQAKKHKLLEEESDPSSKRLRKDAKKSLEGAGDGTGANPDGGEKEAEVGNWEVKNPKLSSSDDGAESSTKRRDNTDHPDETVANEHGGKAIMDLPGELLTKIIDLVPKSQWASLESVSHQFQDAIHGMWGKQGEIRLNELVYKKEKKPYQLTDAVLRKFLIRAPNVVSISGFDEFVDRYKLLRLNIPPNTPIRLETIRLLSKFENLETIDFSGLDIIAAELFAVFLEFSASRQSWKCVNLAGGIYGNMESQEAVESQEDRPALNLEYLKLKMDYLHILDGFLPIQWSALKKLVIVGSIDYGKKVLPVIRQCNQIVHLEVEVPDCRNGQPSFGEFMQAVAALDNLLILKMQAYSWFGDPFQAAVLALIQDVGHRFVDFGLEYPYYCGDEILGAIIDQMKHLKSLGMDVDKCSTPLLVRLANRMDQLETLKLRSSQTSRIDGVVIRAIVGNMSKLQCLHLGHLDVTTEDMNSLVGLRMLKELRIESRVESGTIETWARLGFGSRLETLDLKFRERISPEMAADFFKSMSFLRSVELWNVTDGILQAIAGSCPRLVEFRTNYSNITSTGIQSVIDHCSQLKILQVDGFMSDDRWSREWLPAALTVGKYRKIKFVRVFTLSIGGGD